MSEPPGSAPPGPGESTPDAQLRARKLRDGALFLPLVGLVLLMPPVADLFAVDRRILGVPVVVAYVFAVWAGLILLALRLAARLGR